MAMVDTRPLKHKPNEKHTLDEVLKSLNDLVRGNVLDKSAPPAPAAPKKTTAPPIAGMGDIITSLESLLDNDLSSRDKPAPATPAAKPKPETAKKAADKKPVNPNVLSETDIVRALEEISFDTDFTAKLDTVDAPAAPEIEAIEALPAPEIESIVIETVAPAVDEIAFDGEGDAAGEDVKLKTIQNEIEAAPPPGDTGLEVVEARPNDMSLAEELAAIDFSTDGIDLETPPAPAGDDNFVVEFTPSKKKPRRPMAPKTPALAVPAAAPEPETEELAAPPSTDNDSYIMERAEPPTLSSDRKSRDRSLGEVVELGLSASDTVDINAAPLSDIEAAPEPEPVAEAAAEFDIVTIPPPSESDSTTVELDAPPAPPPRARPKEIPVLKNVAQASAVENFTLEHSPPPKPFAPKPASPKISTHDLHQTAVRVIAKLNIELRKSGKPPLDVKTINRLQQLLKEALGKKGSEK